MVGSNSSTGDGCPPPVIVDDVEEADEMGLFMSVDVDAFVVVDVALEVDDVEEVDERCWV